MMREHKEFDVETDKPGEPPMPCFNESPASPTSILTSVLTSENLRPDIWNVFMIRDFGGGLGGVYLGIERVVVSTEIDPLGRRDLDEGMARILAHELGHSLGLIHTPCVAQGNLMAAGCTLGPRTFLEATQIMRVRMQAETGRPFSRNAWNRNP